MTTDELDDVLALLRTTWSAPPRMPDGAPAAYQLMIGPLPVATVMAGLAVCAEREPRWRPSPAELRAACTAATGGTRAYASPDQAWHLVEQAVRMVGCSPHDPQFGDRHQAAVDWLREQDESVAAWAARRGLCGPGSLGAVEIHDPEFGAVRRRDLHQEHAQIVALARERVQLGGRAFVDHEFQLHHGRGGGMRDLVDQLRPTPALEPGQGVA